MADKIGRMCSRIHTNTQRDRQLFFINLHLSSCVENEPGSTVGPPHCYKFPILYSIMNGVELKIDDTRGNKFKCQKTPLRFRIIDDDF